VTGYTNFLPNEEQLESQVVNRAYMEAKMVVSLAGRYAVIINVPYGTVTHGHTPPPLITFILPNRRGCLWDAQHSCRWGKRSTCSCREVLGKESEVLSPAPPFLAISLTNLSRCPCTKC